MGANERTDKRVAQCLRLYSCLFQTTVHGRAHIEKKREFKRGVKVDSLAPMMPYLASESARPAWNPKKLFLFFSFSWYAHPHSRAHVHPCTRSPALPHPLTRTFAPAHTHSRTHSRAHLCGTVRTRTCSCVLYNIPVRGSDKVEDILPLIS